jgi:hypothetical protein
VLQTYNSELIQNAPREQREALLELLKRERRKEQVLARSFDAQRSFILDISPFVAVQCSRRSGKTMGIAKLLIKGVYEKPGASQLYINLTGEGAERQLCKDCLDVELKRLGLVKGRDYTYNKTKRVYAFANGSYIYLLGMDVDEKEREKALGQKYWKVIVDEGQSYGIDLEDLIYRVLKPAVADYRGQIYLTGTPCNHVFSFYYRVVTGAELGWSVHKWLTEENTFMLDNWRAEIADLKARKPGVEKLPWFKQQYLNQWVIDPSKLVYKYDGQRDLIDQLPEGKYYYALGVDLGWDDATAFTLVAYKDYDPVTYVVDSWKESSLILSRVQAQIKAYKKRYPALAHIVIDNSSKQAVESMKQKLSQPLIPADKAGKEDFIEILNSDFQIRNIKLVRETTEALQQELQTLTWDEDRLSKGHKVEKAGSPNHCCDGFLYAYRFCYAWVDRGLEPKKMTLEQKVEAEEDEEDEEPVQTERAWPKWER